MAATVEPRPLQYTRNDRGSQRVVSTSIHSQVDDQPIDSAAVREGERAVEERIERLAVRITNDAATNVQRRIAGGGEPQGALEVLKVERYDTFASVNPIRTRGRPQVVTDGKRRRQDANL